ncbi:MAG: hypothetical protein O7D86_14230 [Proteobacteria bacterium]|nr:hypothetical protein [Pseudomonadota bacterium]
MLMTIILILPVTIASGLVYLATLDSNYEVKRSLLINADIDVVFEKLRDFKTWPE